MPSARVTTGMESTLGRGFLGGEGGLIVLSSSAVTSSCGGCAVAAVPSSAEDMIRLPRPATCPLLTPVCERLKTVYPTRRSVSSPKLQSEGSKTMYRQGPLQKEIAENSQLCSKGERGTCDLYSPAAVQRSISLGPRF